MSPRPGSASALRVLLIEDNPADALLVTEHLAEVPGIDYDVTVHVRVADGCAALAQQQFDCVLADLGLPDAHGLEVVSRLGASAADVPIVVLSGLDDSEVALLAVEEGAEDYLPKRLADPELLSRAIRHAVQRRRARRQLDASEMRRQAMLDATHDGFIAIDGDGAIIEWNGAAEQLFGWSAGEVLGRPLADTIIPEAGRAAHLAGLARLRDGGEPHTLGRRVEVCAVRRDGTTFPVELTVTAVRDDVDVTYSAFVRDISERRRAEDALRASEELYRTLVTNLPGTGAVLYDHDLRVIKAEGALFQAGTGAWAADDIEGKTPREALGDTADDFVPQLRAALRGQPRSYEWRAADRRRIYWVQDVPVTADDGRITAGLHVVQDITERRRAERYSDVQHAVTQVIAAAPRVERAIPQLLEALADGLGWDVGVVWVHDAARDMLRCRSVWHEPSVPARPFLDATRELELRCGVGLAGQAWLKGRPVAAEEVGGPASFLRAHAGEDVGLRTGVALPISAGTRLLGVVELFTREPVVMEQEGLSVLAGLAGQIGDFVERKRVERDLAEHAAQIATVSDATRKLSRITDPELARRTITDATLAITGGSAVLLAEPVEGEPLLRFGAGAGHRIQDPDIRLGVEPSATALAFMTGERIFVADAPGSRAVSPRLIAETEGRSALFEPVMIEGKTVAVLAVVWSEPVPELSPRLGSAVALLATEAGATIQRANLLAQLNAAARTDPLTQISNRRRWEEELPREVSRSHRTGDGLSVVLLDIDHFKRFNDTHGHPAGDEVLRGVARAFKTTVRDTDLLVRLGGEEFAVLLPGADTERAVALADRLRAAMPDGVTCSCGVASWDGREDGGQLTRRADEALYRAKERGRDRTEV